jgi:protein O-mannosyl-transferase
VLYALRLKHLVQSCGRLKGALLLMALVAAVFWPVLEFDFVGWDDDISVTQNPMITEPWSWSLVEGLFDGSMALRFKPLHWLAFRGVYGLFGLNPVAWHAFGMVLHALAAALFFSVLRVVLRRVFPGETHAGIDIAAWVGAALWAVHPLRVEPVAWVTGSTYPLTAVFLLASYRAYLGGRFVTACLFAVGAYSSYPVGVTYGLWLIATDAGLLRVAPARPWRLIEPDVRRWWFKQLAFLVPAGLAVGMTLWTRTVAPGIFDVAPPSSVVPVGDRLLMGAANLTLFVKKFLWPVGPTPNVGRLDQSVWMDASLLGAAVLTVVVLGGLALGRKRRPLAFWLGCGFVVLALPCLGLTEYPMPPVDRYNHLVDLILAGVVAGAGLLAWRRFKPDGPGIAAGGFAILAVLVATVISTRSLLPAWRNTDSLFSRMEQHAGFGGNLRQQAHIYRLWARHALSCGRATEARWRLALAFGVYRGGIGEALRQGDFAQAIALSRSMEANLRITPLQKRERGYWLMQTGRWEEARRDLAAVAEALPEDTRTKELLALLKTDATPESQGAKP